MRKSHLVLTPDVFALRLDAAIFAHDFANIVQEGMRKPQIPLPLEPYFIES